MAIGVDPAEPFDEGSAMHRSWLGWVLVAGLSLAMGCDGPAATDAGGGDGGGPLDAPGSDTPGSDAPMADVPGLDAPSVDAPSVDAPSVDAPSVDGAVPDGGTDAGALVVSTGHLRGRVVEALTLDTAPVAGATITAINGVSATSDAEGRFDLTGIPVGARTALHVSPPGGGTVYSSTDLIVDVPEVGDVVADARLLRGCSVVMNVGAGDGVRPFAPCGSARVGLTLPEDGVVTESGAPVASVRVELAAIPALASGELAGEAFLAFPGDMVARDDSGAEVWLESRGAAEVRLFDEATGAPARLAPGAEATLTVPAAPGSLEDDAVRLWSYDVAAAEWVEEGSGVIQAHAGTGALVTRMTVSHFTWWNSDQAASRTCLSGRVMLSEDVAGVFTRVMTLGVDYGGSSYGAIAADGTFEVFARSASSADLTIQADLGSASRAIYSARIATGAPGVCTDVGTLEVDVSQLLGCARGRIEDAAGDPVAGAEILGSQRGRAIAARSGTDGSYCLPVLAGLPLSIGAEAVDGAGAPIRGTAFSTATSSSGTCGGASCATLPTVVVRAASCITGTITDGLGGSLDALVTFYGAAGRGAASSAGDGTFCVPVPAGEVYRGYGELRRAGFEVTADSGDVFVAQSAGSCGMPDTCARAELIAASVGCVHGVAVDGLGAPVVGATVRARSPGTARFGRAETGADGSFCVPARVNERATVEIVREDRTRRDYVTFTAEPTATAVCGGSGCLEAGTVTLRTETFATCIRGRLLDGALPVRVPIRAFGFDEVAIVRPREDGTFCLDVDPGPTGRVRLIDLNVPARSGCVGDRDTSVAAPPSGGASCLAETTCTDVGEIDFGDFCASS